MPAKQRILPQPCPKCGRKNGTVQLVMFNSPYLPSRSLICRVGHYDKELYKKPKIKSEKKIDHSIINKNETKFKKVNTRGKVWCSFRIGYESESIDDIRSLQGGKSVTSSMSTQFYELIKKNGWRMLPTSGPNYKRKA